MKVYLCGPINGCSDSDCRDWRERAKSSLAAETLDPMRRDYRGVEDQNVEEIIAGDIADIDASDALLVNAPRASWGTAMEVFYAHAIAKRVVVMVVPSGHISPWQRYNSTFIATSFDEAVAFLNALRGDA